MPRELYLNLYIYIYISIYSQEKSITVLGFVFVIKLIPVKPAVFLG